MGTEVADHDEEASGDETEIAAAIKIVDDVSITQLRQTTSIHDDWLHRGPYLFDMCFYVYCEYVQRERKSGLVTKQPVFLFEPHYELGKTYVQLISWPARLPVMEALKCPSPAVGDGEDNAIYKSILGTL